MSIYLGLISGTSMDAAALALMQTAGISADRVWFAKRTLEGLTSSAGSVTGAKGARILGGAYRYA
jgi:1,6-anhydro-N-acetylmuramate kinase